MKSQKKDLLNALDHLVIELAWSDKVSFEAGIWATNGQEWKTGHWTHAEASKTVIFQTLAHSRVSGRNKKHEKLLPPL